MRKKNKKNSTDRRKPSNTRRKNKKNPRNQKNTNQYIYTLSNTSSIGYVSNNNSELSKWISQPFIQHYNTYLNYILQQIQQHSGKHSIDPSLAQLFIENQVSSVRQQAAKDLVDNTIYITYKEVYHTIEKIVLHLYKKQSYFHSLDTDTPIYMYVGKPTKSFFFLSVLAFYFIDKHQFIKPSVFLEELNDQVLEQIGNSPILLFDDVTYSGNQLSTLLSNIYYKRVVQQKKTTPNIHIGLIALNHFSEKMLSHVPIERTKSGIDIHFTDSPFLLYYLPERLYSPLIVQLGIERYFYLNLFFSPFTESTPYVSLYLDHKLADEASTYTKALLYGPIIPFNYKYKSFLTNIDFLYELIPSKQLFDKPIYNKLIENFNHENNTDFAFFDDSMIKFLYHKLLILDIPQHTPLMKNKYIPFLRGCVDVNIEGQSWKEWIEESDIQSLDYRIFIAPDGCLENNKDCVLTNKGILNYIQDFLSNKKKYSEYLEVRKKLDSFHCPTSFYKSHEWKSISK